MGLKTDNSFTKNLAITFSGNAIGQVLGFIFTPFIARAYGPEPYGTFALFTAVASNFALVSTFQLPTGYVSSANKRELHVVMQFTFFVLLFFTALSILLVIFYRQAFLDFFDAGNLHVLVYFIPVYVFLMGSDYILHGWNIYVKEFSRGAVAKITSVVASKSVTLLYGLVAPSATGLVIGNLLVYPLESAFKLSKRIRSEFSSVIEWGGWDEMKGVIKRFRSYPLLVTPGLLITNLNGQLPVFCFSLYFQQANVGLFALANSLITVPISVITNSTTTVFLQKAAETRKSDPARLKDLVLSLHKKLFLICFLPLTIFAFISEWVFSFAFGAAWHEAGVFAAFLSISTILAVPQQPLSVLFRLMHREYYNLLLNIASIFLRVAGLALGVFYHDIKIAVAGYALATILTMAISLIIIFNMVKIRAWQVAGYLFAVLIAFVVVVLQKLW